LLAVDDNELRMHDAEGEEEDALDLEIEAGELGGRREAQLLDPCGRRIGLTSDGMRLEELLEE
jgi:hypothetical protein